MGAIVSSTQKEFVLLKSWTVAEAVNQNTRWFPVTESFILGQDLHTRKPQMTLYWHPMFQRRCTKKAPAIQVLDHCQTFSCWTQKVTSASSGFAQGIAIVGGADLRSCWSFKVEPPNTFLAQNKAESGTRSGQNYLTTSTKHYETINPSTERLKAPQCSVVGNVHDICKTDKNS